MMSFLKGKDGTVGTITINGHSLFQENKKFDRNVPVVVSYYTLPETPESPEPVIAPETEVQKEAVLQYCTDTYDCVMTAEIAYSQYVNTFSAKIGAGEDAYTLSSELFDQLDECLAFRRELDTDAVEGVEGFSDFNYYASAYISGMMEPPRHVMNALDSKDNINNFDSQESANLINSYRTAYRESLITFLESVGYNWNDVSNWFYNW